MNTTTSTEYTVRLHRVLKAPCEIVYRSFLEPEAVCKWLPPHGFVAKVHYCDVRVGGGYHTSFTNFRTRKTDSFKGVYQELTPNKCIRYTDKFDDSAMPEEMQVTITLLPVSCGTDITIVQENIPPQIPVELCYLGWQESLSQLAALVEPEIV